MSKSFVFLEKKKKKRKKNRTDLPEPTCRSSTFFTLNRETNLKRLSILLPPLAREADVDRDWGDPEDAPMLVAPIPAMLCL